MYLYKQNVYLEPYFSKLRSFKFRTQHAKEITKKMEILVSSG